MPPWTFAYFAFATVRLCSFWAPTVITQSKRSFSDEDWKRWSSRQLVLFNFRNFFCYFPKCCTPEAEIFKQLIKDLLKGSAFCRYASWAKLFGNRSVNTPIRGDYLKAKVISGPIWGLWQIVLVLPWGCSPNMTTPMSSVYTTVLVSLYILFVQDFRQRFRARLVEATWRLDYLMTKLGRAVDDSRPYWEARKMARKVHTNTARAGRRGRLTDMVMAGLKRISNDEYEELCFYLL